MVGGVQLLPWSLSGFNDTSAPAPAPGWSYTVWEGGCKAPENSLDETSNRAYGGLHTLSKRHRRNANKIFSRGRKNKKGFIGIFRKSGSFGKFTQHKTKNYLVKL